MPGILHHLQISRVKIVVVRHVPQKRNDFLILAERQLTCVLIRGSD